MVGSITNGAYLLNAQTVARDTAINQFFGEGGLVLVHGSTWEREYLQRRGRP